MAVCRLLVLVVACADAWQFPLHPGGALNGNIAARRTVVAPTMKHPEYFTRVARAEAGRPRLSVFRSNNHIYGQIIDDAKNQVLCSASTMEAEVREGEKLKPTDAAAEVGKRIAARAKAAGVEKVFFDRNGKKYHGRIMALADGAREGGLSF